MLDERSQGLPEGVEMFPTRILCIKDFKSSGNDLMKSGDSFFTKDRRYNVYVDNRNYKDGSESSSTHIMMQVTNTS